MTNYQWSLMDAAVSKILYYVDLPRNRRMIVYRHWMKKRNNLHMVIFKGVKHHNDKWEIIEGGPVKKTKGSGMDVPFKGPQGYIDR